MSDSENQGAEALFDQIKQDQQSQQINPYDNEQSSPKKHKKIKKHRKDKKKKRQRQRQPQDDEEDQQDRDDGLNSMFQDQADQDDQEEEQLSGAEIQDQAERRGYDQELYKRRSENNFLKKFQGKDGNQINAYYNRQAHKRRQTEEMHPMQSDPKLYTVNVRVSSQEDMAYRILNKASHLYKTQKKVKIVSVLAMKKKFPGKIFVQAFNEKDIRQSLQGFNDVNLNKIVMLDSQSYATLFVQRSQTSIVYKQSDFIRIKKGLYEEDLGKIVKIKKNSADVLLVPRINIQDLLIKLKQQTNKITSQEQLSKKKDQIFRKYTNHKAYYPKNLRPVKKQIFQNDFKDIKDVSEVAKIRLTGEGLIILPYRYDQIMKLRGTFLPIQIQPFSKQGRILEQFQQGKKHFVSSVNFVKGDQVEIIAGQLAKYYGIIVDLKENNAVIKCKSKQMKGNLLYQPLEHIVKRFKEGQRVKVISGTDRGKTGIILKIEDKHAQIWTDNQNSIRVNKNNLQINTGQVICQENVHNLKKDDLIKTSKNIVGIVLATRKDTIKILDTNNTIQIINNLDFDTKINSRSLATKNRTGQLIKNQAIVRVIKGVHQGKRCQVKHVYKEFLFLFNQAFDQTNGIAVQKADNCAVISKNTEPQRRNFQKNINNKPQEQQQLTIGKSIILKNGPLKGYQGIIKSINKDRIQVRVPSKGCTQWVQRDHVIANQKNTQIGKTPHRGPSMTNMYAPSPMTHYY